MSLARWNLKPVVAAIAFFAGAIAVGLCAPARTEAQTPSQSHSQTEDQQASRLLQQLQSAPPDQTAALARDLEQMWSRSGSPALDLLLMRGRDAIEAGDLVAAIEHLTALTDHAPLFAEGWHAHARAYYGRGLLGPALGDLQQALLLNPDNYNALYGLALIFADIGDAPRAARALEQVLALHPHHSKAKTALQSLQARGHSL
jgi:tetratricopeptide (TPR) repeat protein